MVILKRKIHLYMGQRIISANLSTLNVKCYPKWFHFEHKCFDIIAVYLKFQKIKNRQAGLFYFRNY
jgi:hypothetical protein